MGMQGKFLKGHKKRSYLQQTKGQVRQARSKRNILQKGKGERKDDLTKGKVVAIKGKVQNLRKRMRRGKKRENELLGPGE